MSTNLPQTTNSVYIKRVKQMQHMDDIWSEIQDMPGEIFDITELEENDSKKAKEIIENMCKKLLANLVIENYKIIETQ